jgi:hypothetical protein
MFGDAGDVSSSAGVPTDSHFCQQSGGEAFHIFTIISTQKLSSGKNPSDFVG